MRRCGPFNCQRLFSVEDPGGVEANHPPQKAEGKQKIDEVTRESRGPAAGNVAITAGTMTKRIVPLIALINCVLYFIL